jgi:hypothetical protein
LPDFGISEGLSDACDGLSLRASSTISQELTSDHNEGFSRLGFIPRKVGAIIATEGMRKRTMKKDALHPYYIYTFSQAQESKGADPKSRSKR